MTHWINRENLHSRTRIASIDRLMITSNRENPWVEWVSFLLLPSQLFFSSIYSDSSDGWNQTIDGVAHSHRRHLRNTSRSKREREKWKISLEFSWLQRSSNETRVVFIYLTGAQFISLSKYIYKSTHLLHPVQKWDSQKSKRSEEKQNVFQHKNESGHDYSLSKTVPHSQRWFRKCLF